MISSEEEDDFVSFHRLITREQANFPQRRIRQAGAVPRCIQGSTNHGNCKMTSVNVNQFYQRTGNSFPAARRRLSRTSPRIASAPPQLHNGTADRFYRS
jgi:hypothetical protein